MGAAIDDVTDTFWRRMSIPDLPLAGVIVVG